MNHITMYLLVNSDVKMGSGKMAAQCCHAAVAVIRHLEGKGNKVYERWKITGEKTIVLKSSRAIMERLLVQFGDIGFPVWCYPIYDMGLTQVEAGTFTVLAFNPIENDRVPEELRSMKLY